MIRRIKNKRGFLLASQVVKIVIAVICIVFLVYLLASIYFNKINSQKKAEGTAFLERLGDQIRAVHGGIPPTAEKDFPNPKGWYLISFTDATRENKDTKPKQCASVKCLCVCDRVWKYAWNSAWASRRERQVAKCDKSGTCIRTPELKNYEDEVAIESQPGVYITIKKTQEGVDISKK
jgi:hypothetical protein